MADDNNNVVKLFGFEIRRAGKKDPNKENEKLQRQVDLLKVDETGSVALAHVDNLKKELNAQEKEIQRLKDEKDQDQRSYRDTCVQLEELEIAEKKREDMQKATQDYIKKAQAELAQKSDIVKDHAERANNLKSAYNADRRML